MASTPVVTLCRNSLGFYEVRRVKAGVKITSVPMPTEMTGEWIFYVNALIKRYFSPAPMIVVINPFSGPACEWDSGTLTLHDSMLDEERQALLALVSRCHRDYFSFSGENILASLGRVLPYLDDYAAAKQLVKLAEIHVWSDWIKFDDQLWSLIRQVPLFSVVFNAQGRMGREQLAALAVQAKELWKGYNKAFWAFLDEIQKAHRGVDNQNLLYGHNIDNGLKSFASTLQETVELLNRPKAEGALEKKFIGLQISYEGLSVDIAQSLGFIRFVCCRPFYIIERNKLKKIEAGKYVEVRRLLKSLIGKKRFRTRAARVMLVTQKVKRAFESREFALLKMGQPSESDRKGKAVLSSATAPLMLSPSRRACEERIRAHDRAGAERIAQLAAVREEKFLWRFRNSPDLPQILEWFIGLHPARDQPRVRQLVAEIQALPTLAARIAHHKANNLEWVRARLAGRKPATVALMAGKSKLSKTNAVIVAEQWVEARYATAPSSALFNEVLQQAFNLALAYQQEVKSREITRLRRGLLVDMILICAGYFFLIMMLCVGFETWAGAARTMVQFYDCVGVFALTFLFFAVGLLAPMIARIHRAVQENFMVIATPLSTPQLLCRLQATYNNLRGIEISLPVEVDPVSITRRNLAAWLKISDKSLKKARKVVEGTWVGTLFFFSIGLVSTAVMVGNFPLVANVILVVIGAGVLFLLYHAVVLWKTVCAAPLSHFGKVFFRQLLRGAAATWILGIVLLNVWPFGILVGKTFVFFCVLGVGLMSLAVLCRTLKFLLQYKLPFDEAGKILYEAMTDRRLSEAEFMIEAIKAQCQELEAAQKRVPRQDIDLYATILSRILLNPTVCRQAQKEMEDERKRAERNTPRKRNAPLMLFPSRRACEERIRAHDRVGAERIATLAAVREETFLWQFRNSPELPQILEWFIGLHPARDQPRVRQLVAEIQALPTLRERIQRHKANNLQWVRARLAGRKPATVALMAGKARSALVSEKAKGDSARFSVADKNLNITAILFHPAVQNFLKRRRPEQQGTERELAYRLVTSDHPDVRSTLQEVDALDGDTLIAKARAMAENDGAAKYTWMERAMTMEELFTSPLVSGNAMTQVVYASNPYIWPALDKNNEQRLTEDEQRAIRRVYLFFRAFVEIYERKMIHITWMTPKVLAGAIQGKEGRILRH